MFNGKMKAITFSYDDGVTQDRRLIQIFNKYGLKCTFNINSGLFGVAGSNLRNGRSVTHARMQAQEIAEVYAGHEVAVHTLTHPWLNRISPEDAVRETEEDRLNLSRLVGYNVEGMAYPMGTQAMDAGIAKLLGEKTGVRYSRTTTSTHGFEVPEDLMILNPTVHHIEKEKMLELAGQFLALKPDSPKIFYIWGHSYEFDANDDWDWFESFCHIISGRDDIFYGTNREIYLGTDFA